MKQMIYKISCCFLASFLILCSFAVPSFADSSSGEVFSIPYVSGTDYSSGIPIYSNPAVRYACGSNANVDMVGFIYTAFDESNAHQLYFCSTSPISTDDVFIASSDSVIFRNNLGDSAIYNLDLDIYYFSGDLLWDTSGVTDYYAYFTNLTDGLAAARDFIDNGGLDPSPVDPTFSGDYLLEIPKGTVAYIGVPSGGTLTMSGTKVMPSDSNLFGSPWPDDPTRVQVVSSRPSTGENIENVNSGAMPNWRKDDKYQNMWGQTDKASFGPSNWTFDDGPGFLKIYNPFYYGAAGTSNIGGGSFVDNNSLFVTISGYSSIRLYSVKDTIGSTGIVGSVDTPDQYWDKDLTDSNEDGIPDNNTWTASDPGMSSSPDNSQLNQPSAVESISGYLNTITSTLSNFANNIIDLIQAPISHIGQLIDAGSGFMSGLQGLYAWLPSDIQGYITSALSLVVCIGVFKVFL